MSTAPHRARIVGTRHMATAGHYLAAQAAFQILEAGGNAVDAGVAGGIALGVVQCEYVGFGGVAPMMIRPAATGEVVTITGLGGWPKAASLEVLQKEHGGKIPAGILRTVVPAAPDAWITALERFGTMSYGEVADSALRFARDGFPAPSLMCAIVEKAEKNYRRWDENAAIFLPNGKPPQPGDQFVQADLGRTIQYMIDEEQAAAAKGGRAAGLQAARDAFYKGDIARTMVAYHEQNGGWLRADDLAEFRCEVRPPLKVRYGDIDVFTCGPWCQGPVLAQTLRLLDGMNVADHGHNSPAYIHTVVEAFKLAYADRHHHIGDPNFVDVPIEAMLSDGYIDARRALIDAKRASPGMPEPGDPAGFSAGSAPSATAPADEMTQLDTSFCCVVDKDGTLFSATPSDGSAAGPVIPGLGFVPSTRGAQNWTDPSIPAVMAPGKRPRLTPNPAMAIRGDAWQMPFGSPGNDVQCQAMLQVLFNIAEFGMTPLDAIEQPRFASFSYPRSSEPHPYSPGLLNLEGRIPAETADALRGLGHDVAYWPDWDWLAGAVCTIVADTRNGRMEGAADPRRPGAAIGW